MPAADVTTRDIGGWRCPDRRKAAIDFAHSNQIIGLQALVPNELGVTMLPNLAGGRPGQYLKPSMLISVSQTSQNKEAAIALTGFLAYDLDAAAVLGVERGVPGDQRAREFLLDKVNPVERKIDHPRRRRRQRLALPPPPPKGGRGGDAAAPFASRACLRAHGREGRLGAVLQADAKPSSGGPRPRVSSQHGPYPLRDGPAPSPPGPSPTACGARGTATAPAICSFCPG